jgi:penicillin V acylase-like amidase (Ntn superfamily)
MFPSNLPILHSCSTFLLSAENALLVGHNLDDYCHVIGMVVVNKRGISKVNVSWNELCFGSFVKVPKIRWVSKYGSLTYNTRGVEFPDGGMNEAGLYIGEMNLFATRYPISKSLPRIYHNQWVQYLLDNFATVGEVLASLPALVVDGHSRWHFFAADATGASAVIEFLDGKAVVFTGNNMPYKFLCNTAYSKELESIKEYDGFGGLKPVLFGAVEDGKSRFVRAAALFRKFANTRRDDPLKEAFELLDEIRGDNNQWGMIYDVLKCRLYFRTVYVPTFRHVDFSAFDFSSGTPAMFLDINQDFAGEASKEFVAFDDSTNRANILLGFQEIDKAGLLKGMDPVSRFAFTKLVPKRLSEVPKTFFTA